MTPAEVGRLVGVAATTVTRWAREGKLPCIITLGGHRRFEPAVVDQLLSLRKLTEAQKSESEGEIK